MVRLNPRFFPITSGWFQAANRALFLRRLGMLLWIVNVAQHAYFIV